MLRNPSGDENGKAGEPPAHERVYQDLRALLLFGELAPGQAVTIQGIAEDLRAGLTPVREAIRRLIAEGALLFQGNRRVSVPRLTRSDLEQLCFIRKTIDCELTRRAVVRMSDATIARLRQVDTDLDQAISNGDVPGYLSLNYRFHTSIYVEAGAPVLAELAERSWLRFGPSLRMVCGRLGTQNVPDRHKDLLVALAARDSDAAVTAMAQDVEQGITEILGVLTSGGADD